MAIHRADLRNTAFKVGSYNAGGGAVAGPALREAATGNIAVFNNQENEHFTTNANVYRYILTNVQPGLKRVSFAPPAGNDLAYYLPYQDNNITSMTLGAGAGIFFTDNLSGCSIFIDQTPAGDIVVYHANRQGVLYRPSADQRFDAAFEREVAIAVKNQQHTAAKNATYGGAAPLGSLFKRQYMTAAARHENQQRFVGQGDTTVYGTTVVGFRRAGGWRFWYQTWRCDAMGNNYTVVNAERFYP